MASIIRLDEKKLFRIIENAVKFVINEQYKKPTEEEYYKALSGIENATNLKEYEYYQNIIKAYEYEDNLYHSLVSLSDKQKNNGKSLYSRYIMTNGKIINLCYHSSVKEIDDNLSLKKMLEMGNIRLIGGTEKGDVIELELSKKPNYRQEMVLYRIIPSCREVYVDLHVDNGLKCLSFDRSKVGADYIVNSIVNAFN